MGSAAASPHPAKLKNSRKIPTCTDCGSRIWLCRLRTGTTVGKAIAVLRRPDIERVQGRFHGFLYAVGACTMQLRCRQIETQSDNRRIASEDSHGQGSPRKPPTAQSPAGRIKQADRPAGPAVTTPPPQAKTAT